MSTMKKWISLLLVVLLLVSVLPVGAFADEGITITATANATDALNIGDTLEVTFKMSNNPGFLAAEFTLQYDSNVLSFTGLKEKKDEDSGDMILDGTLKTGTIAVNKDTGKIAWANATEITGNNPKLFVAQFKVLGTGNSAVGLTVDLLRNTAGTEYKDSVSVTSSGAVTINGPTTYAVTVTDSANGSVTADKTTAAAGETVTLTVSPGSGFALDMLTVTAGEKSVEVTNNAFAMPAADVTVSATFKQIPAGYTASLGADVTDVVANETVTVPVTIGNTDADVTGFNAYDLTLTYDPNVLEILTESGNGMTVSAKNGTLRVLRYGELLALNSKVELQFKAIGTGQTTVTLTKALVDISKNAHMENAREAALLDEDQKVSIGGYTVTLPEDFSGATAVAPNRDYTFTPKDKNYIYTVSATMGGVETTVEGDGPFTIKTVTGNLAITVTNKVGKTFDVTLTGLTGNPTAQYMTDYSATVTRETGASYTIKAMIGGENYTGFTYDASTGKVTIPGKDITGAVTITATKDEGQQPGNTTKITFTGSGAEDVKKGTTQYAPNGTAFTFEITKADGYDYTVKLGDETLTAGEDGKYTIPADKITGAALTVTVEKTGHIDVTVSQYLTLDEQTAFLVKATGTVPQGSALAYDGGVMFFSTAYAENGQWLYLVITKGTLTVEDAKAKITTVASAEVTNLAKTFDVNETGKVDVNDAQLVYDLYNNKYQDFTVVTMAKFLKADTNADGTVNVDDSAAIIGNMNTTQTAG